MTLDDALRTARAALAHWSEYLEENDREAECEQYDAAADYLVTLQRLADGRAVIE